MCYYCFLIKNSKKSKTKGKTTSMYHLLEKCILIGKFLLLKGKKELFL